MSSTKRKERSTGSSKASNSSPDEKRKKESSDKEEFDEVFQALDMADNMAARLDDITNKLDKLTSIDTKIESVLQAMKALETKVTNLSNDVTLLKTEHKKIQKSVIEIDDGMSSLNKDVEEIQAWKKKTTTELQNLKKVNMDKVNSEDTNTLKTKIEYMEAYSRRENLKFVGIPEEDKTENTKQVLINFLQKEVQLTDASAIEFQRVHRQQYSDNGKPRTIIARFLRYEDVEYVLRNAKNLKNTRYVIYQDFPKAILERRKKLMPAFKNARKEGKKAYFSRTEPDKLYIDKQLYQS